LSTGSSTNRMLEMADSGEPRYPSKRRTISPMTALNESDITSRIVVRALCLILSAARDFSLHQEPEMSHKSSVNLSDLLVLN